MAKKQEVEQYISERDFKIKRKKYHLKKVDAHITVTDSKGKSVFSGNGERYQLWLKKTRDG